MSSMKGQLHGKVQSIERNTSIEFIKLADALKEYEDLKEWEISNEVDENSFVELIVSEDDFENHETLKKATINVDEKRMTVSMPRSEGFDFDYWAKWKDSI